MAATVTQHAEEPVQVPHPWRHPNSHHYGPNGHVWLWAPDGPQGILRRYAAGLDSLCDRPEPNVLVETIFIDRSPHRRVCDLPSGKWQGRLLLRITIGDPDVKEWPPGIRRARARFYVWAQTALSGSGRLHWRVAYDKPARLVVGSRQHYGCSTRFALHRDDAAYLFEHRVLPEMLWQWLTMPLHAMEEMDSSMVVEGCRE